MSQRGDIQTFDEQRSDYEELQRIYEAIMYLEADAVDAQQNLETKKMPLVDQTNQLNKMFDDAFKLYQKMVKAFQKDYPNLATGAAKDVISDYNDRKKAYDNWLSQAQSEVQDRNDKNQLTQEENEKRSRIHKERLKAYKIALENFKKELQRIKAAMEKALRKFKGDQKVIHLKRIRNYYLSDFKRRKELVAPDSVYGATNLIGDFQSARIGSESGTNFFSKSNTSGDDASNPYYYAYNVHQVGQRMVTRVDPVTGKLTLEKHESGTIDGIPKMSRRLEYVDYKNCGNRKCDYEVGYNGSLPWGRQGPVDEAKFIWYPYGFTHDRDSFPSPSYISTQPNINGHRDNVDNIGSGESNIMNTEYLFYCPFYVDPVDYSRMGDDGELDVYLQGTYDNEGFVFINNQFVYKRKYSWSQAGTKSPPNYTNRGDSGKSIVSMLNPGYNLISVMARNQGGPGAILCALTVQCKNRLPASVSEKDMGCGSTAGNGPVLVATNKDWWCIRQNVGYDIKGQKMKNQLGTYHLNPKSRDTKGDYKRYTMQGGSAPKLPYWWAGTDALHRATTAPGTRFRDGSSFDDGKGGRKKVKLIEILPRDDSKMNFQAPVSFFVSAVAVFPAIKDKEGVTIMGKNIALAEKGAKAFSGIGYVNSRLFPSEVKTKYEAHADLGSGHFNNHTYGQRIRNGNSQQALEVLKKQLNRAKDRKVKKVLNGPENVIDGSIEAKKPVREQNSFVKGSGVYESAGSNWNSDAGFPNARGLVIELPEAVEIFRIDVFNIHDEHYGRDKRLENCTFRFYETMGHYANRKPIIKNGTQKPVGGYLTADVEQQHYFTNINVADMMKARSSTNVNPAKPNVPAPPIYNQFTATAEVNSAEADEPNLDETIKNMQNHENYEEIQERVTLIKSANAMLIGIAKPLTVNYDVLSKSAEPTNTSSSFGESFVGMGGDFIEGMNTTTDTTETIDARSHFEQRKNDMREYQEKIGERRDTLIGNVSELIRQRELIDKYAVIFSTAAAGKKELERKNQSYRVMYIIWCLIALLVTIFFMVTVYAPDYKIQSLTFAYYAVIISCIVMLTFYIGHAIFFLLWITIMLMLVLSYLNK